MSSRPFSPIKLIALRKKFREHMQSWEKEQNAAKFAEFPITTALPIGRYVDELMDGSPRTINLRLPGIFHDDGTTTPPQDARETGEPFWIDMADSYMQRMIDDNGLLALVQGLRNLAANPEVTGGRESGAFIAGLLAEVEGRYPGELLALLPSVGHALRASGKHRATDAVKEPVLMKCRAYKEAHPTHGKSATAKKIAPDAFKMNQNAGRPFGWESDIDAYEAIKGWLTPSKSK